MVGFGLSPGYWNKPGFRPPSLELQISENALMQNAEKMAPVLDEVRKKGVQLSIADYGSGHSSLEYLKRFQISSLKLDRAFLRDVTQSKLQESVATAMITLAHSLRIRVAAEDVETEDQLAFLRWHRCDAAQGAFFSPPVSAEDFMKLLPQ